MACRNAVVSTAGRAASPPRAGEAHSEDLVRPYTTATFTQWIGGSESKIGVHASPPSRPIQSWPVVVPFTAEETERAFLRNLKRRSIREHLNNWRHIPPLERVEMTMNFRSKVTGLLTCIAAVAAALSLGFARSTFVELADRSLGADALLSRLTIFALGVTRPSILALVLLLIISAVAAAELRGENEAVRLLVQVVVLLILVPILAIVLTGFLIPFHIPEVTIS